MSVAYSDWVGLTVLGSAAVGNVVDLVEADDHAAALVVVTATTGGSVIIEESDDGSTGWVAIPVPALGIVVNNYAPLVLASGETGALGVNFMRSKRFVRTAVTGTVTFTGVIISRKKYTGS